jgi:hypothetical protein
MYGIISAVIVPLLILALGWILAGITDKRAQRKADLQKKGKKIINFKIRAMKKLMLLIVFLVFLGAFSYAQETGTTTTNVKWIDENFWTMISGLFVIIYEFLALKIPTSKTLSLIGNLYKLITKLIPDRAADGTKFEIKK